MTPTASYLIIFSSLVTLVSIAGAQDRTPHGIANENPIAFSPSAYEFFHPKTQKPETRNPCASASSSCSPLPVAAQVEATKSLDSKASATPRTMGANAIAGIVFGLAFAVLLAMGAFYVLITRRANVNRAKPLQPIV